MQSWLTDAEKTLLMYEEDPNTHSGHIKVLFLRCGAPYMLAKCFHAGLFFTFSVHRCLEELLSNSKEI